MNENYKYTTAVESRKPGYLKQKFDRIRKEQRVLKEEQDRKVRMIKEQKS